MTWLVPDFWDTLTIPALREFSCYGGGENFLYSNFISLVARSPCLLQRLSLHNYQTTDSHFAELRAVPSLVNLSLKEVGITNETLRMLNLSDANVTDSLLPGILTCRLFGGRVLVTTSISISQCWRTFSTPGGTIESWRHPITTRSHPASLDFSLSNSKPMSVECRMLTFRLS